MHILKIVVLALLFMFSVWIWWPSEDGTINVERVKDTCIMRISNTLIAMYILAIVIALLFYWF